MFKNYMKIALRNMLKSKAYSALNIFGLSIGLAATILILVYILFEFSFNDFHKNQENIYRLSVVTKSEGNKVNDSPIFTSEIGPEIKNEIPGIKNYTRFSVHKSAYCSFGETSIKVDKIIYADSTFLDLFTFPLVKGNAKNALSNPYSVILTEKTAQRIFGDSDPINKQITLDNKRDYRVIGIVKNPPANSDIQFNMLISFSSLYNEPNYYMGWDGGNQYYTYLELENNTSPKLIQSALPDFMWKHINERLATINYKYEPYLQPLEDIHLYFNEYSDSGLTNIFIFSIVAFLIIFIASINFINLAIAGASKRIKEIGVRKVLGAGKKNLVIQFFSEYLLTCLFALLLSYFFVEMFFPYFTEIINQPGITLYQFFTLKYILIFAGLILFIGIISSGYPSFYLSSVKTVNSLKNRISSGVTNYRFRNGLVIFQFVISITLIIFTILVSSQLKFIKNKSLGYNKENIIVLPLNSNELQTKVQLIKDEIDKIPGVIASTASSEVPSDGFTRNGYFPEGYSSPVLIHVLDVDEDFLSTYDIQLLRGRNFSKESDADNNSYLVNEKLAKTFNWSDPMGKTIRRNGEHRIIGEVKDFNYASLHNDIAPLIITNNPQMKHFDKISIKVSSANINNTIAAIKNIWEEISPSTLFEFSFLDAKVNSLYKSENNFRELFFYSSSLAIILAVLGLLSLTSLTTERKTKEIGIRKVLGDSIIGVTLRLIKKFVVLVVIANLIAWPVVNYLINIWLDNFAYKSEINYLTFLLVGVSVIIFTSFVIGLRTMKAAVQNPVDSLRYE